MFKRLEDTHVAYSDWQTYGSISAGADVASCIW